MHRRADAVLHGSAPRTEPSTPRRGASSMNGVLYNACGTTAVTSISTLARASISALTSTALIATS